MSIASASASDSLVSDASSTGLGVILLEGDECIEGLEGGALFLLFGCPLGVALLSSGGRIGAGGVREYINTTLGRDVFDMRPTPSELGDAGGKMARDASKISEPRSVLDSV